MKTIVSVLICVTFASCTTEKEIQANMVDVELVKIDTVQRYPNTEKQLLTWRSDKDIEYVTFEPITNNYVIGARMKVMVTK